MTDTHSNIYIYIYNRYGKRWRRITSGGGVDDDESIIILRGGARRTDYDETPPARDRVRAHTQKNILLITRPPLGAIPDNPIGGRYWFFFLPSVLRGAVAATFPVLPRNTAPPTVVDRRRRRRCPQPKNNNNNRDEFNAQADRQ